MITAYHAKYYAHELTRRHGAEGVDRLSQALFDASVDLNPHQIEAALFALRNPLQEGVLLADEVGLGKTIEAALVLCQFWAERRRKLLIICPASLRKQWAQELVEKFAVPTIVVDAQTLRQQAAGNTLNTLHNLASKGILVMSYHFAVRLEAELRTTAWDLVVMDEAHKLRNAHRPTNKMGQSLRRSLSGRKKILLTATPLQNSLMELYGLSTLIDEHLFGDEKEFRRQYTNNDADIEGLRRRMKSFVNRTLRKDVLEYVRYTARRTLTQPFEPTDPEHALYEQVSDFLQRDDSYALPKRQRHLTSLILRKLLASSPYAVVGTLKTIRNRLEHRLEGEELEFQALLDELIADDDLDANFLDEQDSGEEESSGEETNQIDLDQLRAEIDELSGFIQAAESLDTDTKALALLQALRLGFENMSELGAPKKAIIFTESRRTQEFLYRFLSSQGFTGKLTLFSGANNHPDAVEIYRNWLQEHKGSDRVTGSPQVDRRTALLDHFRRDDGLGAEIMIATEAAAEGVNLQFCSLVINYDLPWNPQRVEQRIGRCHRYGQRYDVVVINFLNTRNQADQRVLELLTEKFSLFSGVFGVSDEVLGQVESGIDFEKRVLQIYDTCRHPHEIEAAFDELQKELETTIAARIQDTQTQLLENFDEDVHDRLKLRLDEAEARLDRFGRWFWGLTRFSLSGRAQFDEQSYAFSLSRPPEGFSGGRYQLIRGGAQPDMLAHAYRLSHPLGEWSLAQGLNAETPVATVTLNYSAHTARITVVEQLAGQSGWLTLSRLKFTTVETAESLLITGMTDDGSPLDQDTCERLLGIPAKGKPVIISDAPPAILLSNSQRSIEAKVSEFMESNDRLFAEERDKLEAWSDDRMAAVESDMKNTKTRLAQLKRDARNAPTLQEQQVIQQSISEYERLQRRQRAECFDLEDQISEQRDELLDTLQKRLQQTTESETLFTLRWQVI